MVEIVDGVDVVFATGVWLFPLETASATPPTTTAPPTSHIAGSSIISCWALRIAAALPGFSLGGCEWRDAADATLARAATEIINSPLV